MGANAGAYKKELFSGKYLSKIINCLETAT
jgi:hypothetical protein